MLILASASPRRRELLRTLGVEFRVAAADVDEAVRGGALAEQIVTELARRKARAIAEVQLPTGGTPDAPAATVVLGADTLVVSAVGEVLGKPRDAADARRMLRALSGTTHRVVTGVCVIDARRDEVAHATTHVTMRAISDAEIDAYIASGEPFDKAGAYAIQETGGRFVTRIEGSWSNVVGLPLELVAALLGVASVLGGGRVASQSRRVDTAEDA